MSPVNQFIVQARYRIDQREKGFLATVDALYSKAGVTGQIGALREGLFNTLRATFVEEINEIFGFVDSWGPVSELDEQSLLSLTAQLLSQSAIGLKAMVNLDRLKSFLSSPSQAAQTARIAARAFSDIDTMLQLRMQEFARRRTSPRAVAASPTRAAFGLFGKPHLVPIFSAEDIAAPKILVALGDFGFDVWDRTVPAGEDREDFLLRAISEVNCVLGFFSSLDGVQLDALRVAFDQNKLLPVVVGDKQLPFGFTALEPVRIVDPQRLSGSERQRLLEGAVRLSGYHPPIRR